MRDWIFITPPPAPTRRDIARDVAAKHGLTVEQMQTRAQHRSIAWPRQEAMARMIEAGFSTTKAGAFFGRDHTTAIHAKCRMDERRALAQQEVA